MLLININILKHFNKFQQM